MKILAVGMNYPQHIEEFAKLTDKSIERPSSPIFFLKGDALHRKGFPFFYPDFTNEIDYETEIVVRIDRIGKHIQERFANRYYSEISLGLDLTARDRQREAKQAGLPWSTAKAFDDSAVVGDFLPKEQLGDLQSLTFCLERDGKEVQRGCSRDMIFSIDRLISEASRIFTLRQGDLLFTGTPAGVGPINIGDTYTGYLAGNKILELRVK